MKSPITIVIPAYNREKKLERTLDSIAMQTVYPAELILVDNNSSDSTLRIMRQWAGEHPEIPVMVLSEMKKGACAARNRGLKEVTTDYVMFFDSDDIMSCNHVADFTNAIALHPDVDIFGRDIEDEDRKGLKNKAYFTDRNPMFNHLFKCCLSTQRIVVRTELVRRVGAWNEQLPGWDDFELGVRLLLSNPKLLNIGGQPSVRKSASMVESITGIDFSSHPERWEKSLDCVEKSVRDADRIDLVKWVDCRRMILAAHYAREAKRGDEAYRQKAGMLRDRLRDSVLSKSATPVRLKMVYYHNYYLKRLTWLLCRLIF